MQVNVFPSDPPLLLPGPLLLPLALKDIPSLFGVCVLKDERVNKLTKVLNSRFFIFIA